MTALPPPSARVRAGYSLGSLATAAFGTVPGLLLLPYLTDSLAIPAAVAGVLVLLPKAWDVVFNPVAGRVSDASRHPDGPRRPFLLRGGLSLAVLFALLFLPPLFGSPWLDGAYVAVVFVLCATAFAFFQVPYNALPPELATTQEDRTRLTAWRIAVLALGILVCGAGAPLVRDEFGYLGMGVGVGLVIVVGTAGVMWGTKHAPRAKPQETGVRGRELVALLRQARRFRVLLTAFVIQSTAIGTLLAGVDYLARVVLGEPGAQTLLFAAFVGPALVVMPVLRRVAARWGVQRSWSVATVLFAAAFGGIAFGPPTPVLIGLVALGGVAYAGLQVFPLTLLADLIADEEAKAGQTRAGLFAGVWTAGDTLGLALGPGLFGLVLGIGGYAAGADPAAQPGSASTAIVVGFAVLPPLLVLATLPLLRQRGLSAPAARPGAPAP
ncbi:MFS transporter [Actinokineospora pegani]|uniref:MFS transporter n=1 Tax=Actinokineospora pegani TaxID=2654637 RepID=UPI0012E9FD5A|nr:MFS transporter [Actinokineospora pegani]